MPVEEHEVHEKVRIAAGQPYGCHGRDGVSKGYYAPDRVYRPDGTFYIIQAFIKHAMSDTCRAFYLWDTDPRCEGCTADKDINYANTMKDL